MAACSVHRELTEIPVSLAPRRRRVSAVPSRVVIVDTSRPGVDLVIEIASGDEEGDQVEDSLADDLVQETLDMREVEPAWRSTMPRSSIVREQAADRPGCCFRQRSIATPRSLIAGLTHKPCDTIFGNANE